MPFNRPTLAEIFARVKVDIEDGLGVVGALLRRAVATVLGKALSGAAHLLYGNQLWISRQVFPDTADDDNLRRWASIWNIQQVPAAFATGTVTATGSNGIVIPSGTILTRSDGKEYATTADATISSGTATVSVQASVAEEAGNADVATVLTFQSPIVGINSTTAVVSLSGGADIETIDALRARLLARISEPPLGGVAADYEAWGKQVSGVTRVWVKPLYNGAGTVGIFFVRDNESPIFPDTGEVSAVQTYIDTKRPIPAIVNVYAPTGDTMNFNISLTPATTEVKAAVTSELQDLILREGQPGGTILLSHIQESISTAAGETDHVLNSPTGNFVSTAGKIPVFGTITWS
jgi:uncharacterized phage protein gp47/JayE